MRSSSACNKLECSRCFRDLSDTNPITYVDSGPVCGECLAKEYETESTVTKRETEIHNEDHNAI